MKKILLLFVIAIAFVSLEAKNSSFMLGEGEPEHIFINNRILARVNNKAISVMDVMKRMDMMFYRQFPEYTNSAAARFQYYQMNWKAVLDELIEKEMIVADATEHKLAVTSGDIRQEMETLFGPNIIVNLDKVGLSFDEAWEMVKNDITIRRMVYLMSNAKALKKVIPKDVRKAYEEYSKENVRPEQWQYQVLSIRSSDAEQGNHAAEWAFQQLADKKTSMEELVEKMKTDEAFNVKATVSELLTHEEKDLSNAYKEALSALASDSYSKPQSQTSRVDKSTVYRIFYLKEHRQAGVPALNEVEKSLQDKLLDEAVEKETIAYLDKLRQHYHLKKDQLDLFSDGFEPFALK